MKLQRVAWRNAADWKAAKLPLSTPSDEACKMFDAALTQYVGWYEDDSLGGLDETLQKLIAADPNFVMGHVMKTGLVLLGSGATIRKDENLKYELEHLQQLAASQQSKLSLREADHCKALQLWAKGDMPKATEVWENILVDHPTDMLALKMAHDTYFYLGYQPQIRDSIARVLPSWKRDDPLYSYLHGMYAFGLVETNFYSSAEKMALKGLEENPYDAWATHALAHVYEMEGRVDEGISFLSKTIEKWEPCGLLACHNFWHWSLYHIEKGEYEAALDLFDTQVGKRVHSGAMLDIVDATSLLYRLELEGVPINGRWHDVYDICKPHIEDHVLSFNDAHIIMSCLGANEKSATEKLVDSLAEFVRTEISHTQLVAQEVGLQLCQAMVAFSEGQYGKAVSLAYPIRYKIVKIGGSNAQRDLFNLFLIIAALKSNEPFHHKLAKHLLWERKALKEKSPLTDRLINQVMQHHDD